MDMDMDVDMRHRFGIHLGICVGMCLWICVGICVGITTWLMLLHFGFVNVVCWMSHGDTADGLCHTLVSLSRADTAAQPAPAVASRGTCFYRAGGGP